MLRADAGQMLGGSVCSRRHLLKLTEQAWGECKLWVFIEIGVF